MKALLLLLLLAGAARAEEDPGFRQTPGALVPLGGLLHGRPTALALVYYHCTNLCGILLADFLSAVQQSGLVAGKDYDLLVMSIDPADQEADADEAKAQHISRFPLPGAQVGWHFLTKDAAVERAVGYSARFDQATQQFEHPAGIVMLTPPGRVSNYLLGVGYTPKQVADALRAAGQGEIAQPQPEIRLFCFRYDSATGRYSLAIFRALQLFGGLAAAGLALALFLALRWERR
jgi:protein SCO1/2